MAEVAEEAAARARRAEPKLGIGSIGSTVIFATPIANMQKSREPGQIGAA